MIDGDPAQYDRIELIIDIVKKGRVIPRGTLGTIVELQGHPVAAFTVEFDHNEFGDSFLPDLQKQRFRIVSRDPKP